jgi:glycosyltransferase involved in cell wall biosynthesis
LTNYLKEKGSKIKNKRVILFLGRIHWIKGMDLLARAYARLARERNDVHLLIVGPDEGGYEKKVRKWLKDAGVLEQVTFAGMLEGKEKLEAFAGSDLFVLPSYSESFGMAVVEAMACGLPVIISNQVGIYKEVQRANAGLVVKSDSTDLYNALMRLLNNNKEAFDMGTRGMKFVKEKFDIESVTNRMIEAFKDISIK